MLSPSFLKIGLVCLCLYLLILECYNMCYCIHDCAHYAYYHYKLIGRATRVSQLALGPTALACIQTLNYMLTLLILWFIYYKYH